ncbi:lymphocyte antigen 6E-like [Carettochelys insculpta]|uniref:lymphocyte antigen 6E-like n=1 Tax=Carettochelys insculpta TaxID=44489 RepID=UPI003EBC7C60
MKAVLLALLAAALCGGPAYALWCFACSDSSSNWGCLRPTVCPDDANYCVTTYLGAGIGARSGQSISKGCASVCPNAGINLGILAASVSCCNSFLCNISGASSVKVSYSVLAMAVLASLVYIRAAL